MNMFLAIALGIALLAVLAVLATGIVVMARGGEVNKNNSNKLMRWRVILQAVALVIFALILWLGKSG